MPQLHKKHIARHPPSKKEREEESYLVLSHIIATDRFLELIQESAEAGQNVELIA
jgi:hypothetical protein